MYVFAEACYLLYEGAGRDSVTNMTDNCRLETLNMFYNVIGISCNNVLP